MNNIKENSTYRKVEIKTDALMEKYQIEKLPALLIFKDNNLLGKIEGYYSIEQKEDLINEIKELIK